MIIRPAREDDYDDIARVWYEGYLASAYGVDGPVGITEADLRARIPGDIAHRGWNLYAVEEDGAIVAMLATIPRERALDQIFLADGARGRGLGRQLIDFVRREMPEGWLRTHISNMRAQGFYEHVGMTHTHDAPHPHHPEAMFRWYAWKP
ncbi:MAG TPA: GNAT family N-acetyltransferase [Rhizomicrobium sp.]|jgi:GNAT superfamily N-acetyltransferase|nr:GNAT family N-acetyltransferase [Rhizomicrobium sp.]